jgi:hypothetical protein
VYTGDLSGDRQPISDADGEARTVARGHFPGRIGERRPRGSARLEATHATDHGAIGAAEDDVDAVAHAQCVDPCARLEQNDVTGAPAQQPPSALEPALRDQNACVEPATISHEGGLQHGLTPNA